MYGSIARGEELSESDVDLMVVGSAKLVDLSPPLAKAEERLARQVNATLFSSEEFARKLRQGHHFLKSVMQTERLFVVGSPDDLAGIAQG